MENRILVIGLVLLLLFSSVVPISMGYDVKTPNIKRQSLVRGNTLYVGGSGQDNYTRIQYAIDNTSDGDTVFVYDDSSPYYENIMLDKSIELIGEDKNITVIDGGGHDDVVYITGNNAKISGFKIQNSGKKNWQNNWDGGVDIRSRYNVIDNNIIYSNYYGIVSIDGSFHTFTNNTIINNYATGIVTWDDGNNIIVGNNISYNRCGISLPYHDGHHKVFNNFINSNGGTGISISGNNITVSHNVLINDGFFIDDDTGDNNIFNNTANGKPIIYFENKANMIIDEDAGQIILLRCANIQITGQIISNTRTPVQILYSNNCLVKNCVFSNNGEGIDIKYSDNNRFSDNVFSSNGHSGVSFFYSSKNTFVNNVVSNNKILGVSLTGSCNGNSILNNTIENSESGVTLSEYNMDGAINNVIAGNNISGIERGLNLWSSYHNIIYCNNFINNFHHVMDFSESSKKNLYYNPLKHEGNFWDDYVDRYPDAKPRDDNPDIWDTPYVIKDNYNEYGIDKYPLIEPCTDFKIHSRVRFVTFSCEFPSLLLCFIERFPFLQKLLNRFGQLNNIYFFIQ